MDRYRNLGLNDVVTYEGLSWRVEVINGPVVTLVGQDHPGRLAMLASSAEMDDVEITGRVAIRTAPERTLREIGMAGTPDERDARAWLDVIYLIDTGRSADADESDPVAPEFDPTVPLSTRVAHARTYLQRRGVDAALSTIYRKRQEFNVEPSILTLVDGRKTRRSRVFGDADTDLIDKMRDVVSARKPGSTVNRKLLVGEVRALLRAENPEYVFRHRATMYRYLDQVMAEEGWASTAKQRNSSAKLPDGSYGQTKASRPGEFVHADSTKIDCFMLDEEGRPRRYELSILLDVFSTHVLGFSLVGAATAADIVRLLARASFPPALRPMATSAAAIAEAELAPRQLVNWANGTEPAPYVAIETLVIDNGSIYVAAPTKQICRELGVSLRYSRTYTPEDKAKVERAMRTIETGLIQCIPGFVSSSPDHRGKESTIVAAGLLHRVAVVELLTEWFEKVWANAPSKGLSDPFNRKKYLSPRQVLTTATAIAPSIPVPIVGDAYIRLLKSDYRKIQHYGIDHAGMVFDSDNLIPYRRKASPDLRGDGKWLVKWDPDYPIVLWVRNYEDHNWMMCPWVRIGDFSRPFASEILRHAGESDVPVVEDTDRATRELVNSYRARLEQPEPPAPRTKVPKPKAGKRTQRSAIQVEMSGVRLLTGDEEIDL